MATYKAKSSAPVACSASGSVSALSASTIAEEKHLATVLRLTVCSGNEGGEMMLCVGSAKTEALGETFYPFFLHNVFAGLIPPSPIPSSPFSTITGSTPFTFIPTPSSSYRSLPSITRHSRG